MKVRIIKTGEEVTAIAISKKSGTVQCCGSDGICHQYESNDKEIEFISTTGTRSVSWKQRRYEIARDVLAVSFAQPMSAISLPSYTHICVQQADVLIDELRKKGKCVEQKQYIINELQTDKINYFTEFHFNLFHTDLVCHVIQDNDLSFDILRNGINGIREAGKEDRSEYIPKGWEKV